MDNSEKDLWYVSLPHEKIVDLIWVLEGYEGLALPRVLDKQRGIVELLTAPDTQAELEQVLKSLADRFPITRIEKPEGVASIADDAAPGENDFE